MPAIADIIRSDAYARLKRKLSYEPAGGVDKIFDVAEQFTFDAARADDDQKKLKWFGVTAKLYNFGIGVETGGSGAAGNDDVQYVGICKCPVPKAVHTPEYTDLPEMEQRVPDQTFGAFDPLTGEPPVRFGVFCNAFNNDGSEAWSGIVEALQGDVSSAMTLGIEAVPGLSQFATPAAVGRAISELVREGLTDQPVPVSGDEIVCDTVDAVQWFRKIDKSVWRARKWMLHTLDPQPAWYLSQWFITLSTEIRPYEYASVPGSSYFVHLSGSLGGEAADAKADLAAIYVLRGQTVATVAERMKLSGSAVTSALNSLRQASFEEASARVQAALLRAAESP